MTLDTKTLLGVLSGVVIVVLLFYSVLHVQKEHYIEAVEYCDNKYGINNWEFEQVGNYRYECVENIIEGENDRINK